MSPKRRYQSSSLGIGLPPPPLPPPEYFANLTYSYNRPITSSEIAVNPCLTSKKITTTTPSTNNNNGNNSTSSKKGSKPKPPPPPKQKAPAAPTPTQGQSSSSKGNRTYRVKHHHQNHYEPPIIATYQHGGGAAVNTNTGGDQSRPPSSLSQGMFGLPSAQDYFNHNRPSSTEETLADQHPPPSFHHPPPPKPRMKSTLPSFKNIPQLYQAPASPPPPDSTSNNYYYHLLHPQEEDMDGIIQVRPASRQSRTRPEPSSSSGGGNLRKSAGGGARRRVQSTSGFLHPYNKPSTPIDPPPDISSSMNSEHLDSILMKLKSQDSDWEEIVDGFHLIQRFTSENSSIIKPILRKIIWAGLPHLSSSRTKLSRAACQCFKILYETQRRSMEGEGDKVFQRLLDLCGGPHNKFIQEECKVALQAAVKNTDPLKCLILLEQQGAKHKNPNVREFAALLLSKIMDVVVPADKVLSKEFAQRIIPMIAGFLNEGQLNTRLNGKQCLSKICTHPDFQTTLRKFVPKQQLRQVLDILKKFQQSPTIRRGSTSTAWT